MELTEFGRGRSAHEHQPKLTTGFAALGQASKVRRLAAAISDSALLTRFPDTGANTNAIQQVRSSFPVAAGLQGRLEFGQLIRVQTSPPARALHAL